MVKNLKCPAVTGLTVKRSKTCKKMFLIKGALCLLQSVLLEGIIYSDGADR
jgi:hypothetical protein